MKIMVIATGFYYYGRALAHAFEELGHDVHLSSVGLYKEGLVKRIYGKLYYYRYASIGSDLLYLSPPWWQYKESNRILEEYKNFKPDIVISFPAYDLCNSVIKRMYGCKKAIWIYDAVHNVPGIINKLRLYDSIFVFEKGDVESLAAQGLSARFLPLCADDSIYKKLDGIDQDIDVSFVGKISEERFSTLLGVIRAFSNKRIEIYGIVPNRIKRGLDKYDLNALPKEFKDTTIAPEDVNILYNRSRVCLNIHKEQSTYGANMRLYETLAACTFEITDWNRYIEDEFAGCVGIYNTEEELKDLLSVYLEEDNQRLEVLKRGYEKVHREHTFVCRAKEMLECLNDNPKC